MTRWTACDPLIWLRWLPGTTATTATAMHRRHMTRRLGLPLTVSMVRRHSMHHLQWLLLLMPTASVLHCAGLPPVAVPQQNSWDSAMSSHAEPAPSVQQPAIRNGVLDRSTSAQLQQHSHRLPAPAFLTRSASVTTAAAPAHPFSRDVDGHSQIARAASAADAGRDDYRGQSSRACCVSIYVKPYMPICTNALMHVDSNNSRRCPRACRQRQQRGVAQCRTEPAALPDLQHCELGAALHGDFVCSWTRTSSNWRHGNPAMQPAPNRAAPFTAQPC